MNKNAKATAARLGRLFSLTTGPQAQIGRHGIYPAA